MWRTDVYPAEIDPQWKKYTPPQHSPKFTSFDRIMRYIHGGGDPVKDTLEACRRNGKDFLHRGVHGLSLFNYDYVPADQRVAMAPGLRQDRRHRRRVARPPRRPSPVARAPILPAVASESPASALPARAGTTCAA